jgi:hypothetical protein
MRVVQLVHTIPGRTRLRCSWIRGAPDAAGHLAERLASLSGVREVRARPYTGGVLVTHARELDPRHLVDAARDEGDAELVLGRGERRPPPRAQPVSASVARAAALFFRELNDDLLRASDGRADLGTLATLGFLGAGALEVVATKQLPIPPWFNLAWWGFRTFMSLEGTAMQEAREAAVAHRDGT